MFVYMKLTQSSPQVKPSEISQYSTYPTQVGQNIMYIMLCMMAARMVAAVHGSPFWCSFLWVFLCVSEYGVRCVFLHFKGVAVLNFAVHCTMTIKVFINLYCHAFPWDVTIHMPTPNSYFNKKLVVIRFPCWVGASVATSWVLVVALNINQAYRQRNRINDRL